jgi:hypothetical protein
MCLIITGLNLRTIFTSRERFSQWELVSSVYLERAPVIARDLNDIEQRFHKLQSNIEFESSLKSDHERRKEQDRYVQLTITDIFSTIK